VSPAASSVPASNHRRHAGLPGLLAAATIGLQALGCAGFANFFLFAARDNSSLSPTSPLPHELQAYRDTYRQSMIRRGGSPHAFMFSQAYLVPVRVDVARVRGF
jgi:hypothetical protein